jgi:hypothetical protein
VLFADVKILSSLGGSKVSFMLVAHCHILSQFEVWRNGVSKKADWLSTILTENADLFCMVIVCGQRAKGSAFTVSAAF